MSLLGTVEEKLQMFWHHVFNQDLAQTPLRPREKRSKNMSSLYHNWPRFLAKQQLPTTESSVLLSTCLLLVLVLCVWVMIFTSHLSSFDKSSTNGADILSVSGVLCFSKCGSRRNNWCFILPKRHELKGKKRRSKKKGWKTAVGETSFGTELKHLLLNSLLALLKGAILQEFLA